MQKWEEIEQKKEYLKGYIKAKNREALIKDQIQQGATGLQGYMITKLYRTPETMCSGGTSIVGVP